jgi:hypothetical protein
MELIEQETPRYYPVCFLNKSKERESTSAYPGLRRQPALNQLQSQCRLGLPIKNVFRKLNPGEYDITLKSGKPK